MPSNRSNGPNRGRSGRQSVQEEARETPQRSSKGPLIAVMAVLVVALLIVIFLYAFLSSPSSGAETSVVTDFSSGSDNIVLGGKDDLLTGYIKLPKDAKVKHAAFNVTGELPFPLERFEVGVEPLSIISKDLEGDGDPDIVVLNAGSNRLDILKNLGPNGFILSDYETPANSIQLIVEHINEDDYLDLAVVSTDQTVSVYLTKTDDRGKWDFNYPTRSDYPVGEFSSSLCALDYDRDGDLDLAVTCKNSDSLDFLKNLGDGTFEPAGTVDAERKPGDVVSGDFDGDGDPDLAVFNRGDKDYTLDGAAYRYTVSIFENKGGSFTGHVDYGVGENPSAIDLCDIDLDGDIDIVVANEGYGVDSVSVLLNNGDGTFPAGNGKVTGARLFTTMDPNDVICSDMNGDSYPDVVTACRTTDSIAVLLNDGTGGLGEFKHYFVGYSPKAIASADFDGDGDNDIATANMRALNTSGPLSGSVSIIRNLGYGVFSTDREYQVGNCPRGISAADFDNDGDLDISTANYFGSTLSLLPNDGEGRFGEQSTYLLGLEPYAVQAGDFDGDGYLDVASADEARFVVIILFNDGTGKFKNERPDYNIGGYPFSLHVDDYNGDGFTDVITANHGQSTLAILYNTGNGTFHDYIEVDLGESRMPFNIAVEDVNGDDHRDIITANLGTDNNHTNTISVLFNNGDNTYQAPKDFTVGYGPTDLAIDDFDGDGDNDIASSNLADGTVSVLMNDGSGMFTLRSTIPIGWKPYFLESLDFDSDGDPDIVATNSHSNSMSFLRNDGSGGFTKYYEKTTGSYPYQIEVCDFDSDGRDDIVVTNVNTASVMVVSDYYYPTNVALDLDKDPATAEYKVKDGVMDGSVRTADLAGDVQDYLDTHQHLADADGNILVPITILHQEAGMVRLSDLRVEYRQ